MQLKQLAGQVFVQPPVAPAPCHGLRADRLRIVQVQQHGGMHDGSAQQRFVRAPSVRANGFVFMRPDQGQGGPFGRGHTKMIGPKLHPAFCHRRRGLSHVLPAFAQSVQIGLAKHLPRWGHRTQRVLGRVGVGGCAWVERCLHNITRDLPSFRTVDQTFCVKCGGALKLRQDPRPGIIGKGLQMGLRITESMGCQIGGLHAQCSSSSGFEHFANLHP